MERDDYAEARTMLEEALALWRGPALADFAYEAFAQPGSPGWRSGASRPWSTSRGGACPRPRSHARPGARGPGREAPDTRAPPRPAHARALPSRPSGRRAGGLRVWASGAHRRARRRTGPALATCRRRSCARIRRGPGARRLAFHGVASALLAERIALILAGGVCWSGPRAPSNCSRRRRGRPSTATSLLPDGDRGDRPVERCRVPLVRVPASRRDRSSRARAWAVGERAGIITRIDLRRRAAGPGDRPGWRGCRGRSPGVALGTVDVRNDSCRLRPGARWSVVCACPATAGPVRSWRAGRGHGRWPQATGRLGDPPIDARDAVRHSNRPGRGRPHSRLNDVTVSAARSGSQAAVGERAQARFAIPVLRRSAWRSGRPGVDVAARISVASGLRAIWVFDANRRPSRGSSRADSLRPPPCGSGRAISTALAVGAAPCGGQDDGTLARIDPDCATPGILPVAHGLNDLDGPPVRGVGVRDPTRGAPRPSPPRARAPVTRTPLGDIWRPPSPDGPARARGSSTRHPLPSQGRNAVPALTPSEAIRQTIAIDSTARVHEIAFRRAPKRWPSLGRSGSESGAKTRGCTAESEPRRVSGAIQTRLALAALPSSTGAPEPVALISPSKHQHRVDRSARDPTVGAPAIPPPAVFAATRASMPNDAVLPPTNATLARRLGARQATCVARTGAAAS